MGELAEIVLVTALVAPGRAGPIVPEWACVKNWQLLGERMVEAGVYRARGRKGPHCGRADPGSEFEANCAPLEGRRRTRRESCLDPPDGEQNGRLIRGSVIRLFDLRWSDSVPDVLQNHIRSFVLLANGETDWWGEGEVDLCGARAGTRPAPTGAFWGDGGGVAGCGARAGTRPAPTGIRMDWRDGVWLDTFD